MKEDLKRIIADAILAPSGENCQPWKFIVRDNTFELLLLPERDRSQYGWGQRASYMANGAFIENFRISALEYGYESKITLLPEDSNPHIVARISLNKSSVKKDELYKYIAKRSSNRKPYCKYELKDNEKNELFTASNISDMVHLYISTDQAVKKTLGKVGSTNEKVMLENEHLHNFFFSHINWNKEEDDEKKIGFYIDTLELPPPAKVMFKILRNWKFARLLNIFGFNKLVAFQNSVVNSKSAAFGALTIGDMSVKSFIEAGMVLERIWLTATKLGLSFQPVTGILFFMHKVRANDTSLFANNQVEYIKSAYKDVLSSFSLSDDDLVVFMFRVGKGGDPTARSARFSPEEVIEYV